jgi:hypothetical protein
MSFLVAEIACGDNIFRVIATPIDSGTEVFRSAFEAPSLSKWYMVV